MKIEEIKDFLLESKCRNMLLSVLRRIKIIQLHHNSVEDSSLFAFNRTIAIGVINFSSPIQFNFGNFQISLERILVDEIQPIWLRFREKPDELAEIIQKLIQPFNGKVLVKDVGGMYIHLKMEEDPDFVLENTNLYLAFKNFDS